MENTPNTVSKGKTVFVSAGDVSGDIHAAHLVEALKELDPSVHIIAIGGPRLKELADEFILDLASQGVLGFVEPLKKLPLFAKLIKQVRHIFQTQRPNAFVAVDFYGLNHQFLNAAKAENIPAYYYVTPQVWASRQYRAKQLAALTRKMYVIYPFEPEFHKARGGNAVFLGNPLLDNMPAAKPKNFEVSDPKPMRGNWVFCPAVDTERLHVFYRFFTRHLKKYAKSSPIRRLIFSCCPMPMNKYSLNSWVSNNFRPMYIL